MNWHIKVPVGKNQVEHFHQAFCTWYVKLREADSQALIFPWAPINEEGLLIKNPMDIPTALPLF